ncbi:hypothetical protein EA797_05700 [Stutzerimonas zhaodongensis]|uniref:Uncharacterized protein n=1 Tax=Stutzerimonas zhaodongensis TaxID=1176257 RepID=A0A3M2HZ59_9GAMM|nr:hypothetical protein [Stutzerimonas zhaodongensis]MCQ4314708.1 hypothetical protein [Stutzerimonas zhaodongensis]RMH92212.1 hypothetical protein EA797_05700 [Stutzerimonas zhaodongensis]
MDSANQTNRPLVYADGYSYTEIFQAPELPGTPASDRLISVFHAFFTADPDHVHDEPDVARFAETSKLSGNTV